MNWYGQLKVEMGLGVEVGGNLATANHPCPIYTSSHSWITSQLCQFTASTGTRNHRWSSRNWHLTPSIPGCTISLPTSFRCCTFLRCHGKVLELFATKISGHREGMLKTFIGFHLHPCFIFINPYFSPHLDWVWVWWGILFKNHWPCQHGWCELMVASPAVFFSSRSNQALEVSCRWDANLLTAMGTVTSVVKEEVSLWTACYPKGVSFVFLAKGLTERFFKNELSWATLTHRIHRIQW